MCGGVLVSHRVPPAVPSALGGLTSGFGMGPGVSLSPWPPQQFTGTRPRPGGTGFRNSCGTGPHTHRGLIQLSPPGGVIQSPPPGGVAPSPRTLTTPKGGGRAARGLGTSQWTRTPERSRKECETSPRPLGTGQLHMSPCFHIRPINPVVYRGPYQTILREPSS